MGSEFIDFIATVMTCRMIRKARGYRLMNTMLYEDLMSDLSEAWRRSDGSQEPSSDDGYWKEHQDEMEAPDLSKPVQKPAPKKPDRPKKVHGQEADKPGRPR